MVYVLSFILLVMFVQDLKDREISLILFPTTFVLSILLESQHEKGLNILWNGLFLVFVLGALTLYLSVKYKKWINITQGYFSIGDCIFLFTITPLFSLENYVLFFTLSTASTLFVFLLTSRFMENKTIPYAGFVALFLIIVLHYPNWAVKFHQLSNIL